MNPRDLAPQRAKKRSEGPRSPGGGGAARRRGQLDNGGRPARGGLGRGLAAAAALLAGLLGAGAAHAAGQTATLHRVEGPETGTLVVFGVLAGLTLLGALATITRRNPVTAALCLVWTLFCSAGLYLLLHASFMAVIQVLVYAGAIMVLFVLVVMSVERPDEEELGLTRGLLTKVVGIIGLSFLLILFVMILSGPEARRATSEEGTACGGPQAIQCTGNFECKIARPGPDAAGTWNLAVTLPGAKAVRFEKLPFQRGPFTQLQWLGFSSTATEPTVFYLDNIELERSKPQAGAG